MHESEQGDSVHRSRLTPGYDAGEWTRGQCAQDSKDTGSGATHRQYLRRLHMLSGNWLHSKYSANSMVLEMLCQLWVNLFFYVQQSLPPKCKKKSLNKETEWYDSIDVIISRSPVSEALGWVGFRQEVLVGCIWTEYHVGMCPSLLGRSEENAACGCTRQCPNGAKSTWGSGELAVV